MPEPPTFGELICRVRAGDPDAAAELVRRYEPSIRRAVRFRLTDPRLGRVVDSMDICQSVLASFFVRAATGQYHIDSPEQLMKLLVGMARNKVAFQVRHERAQCRDNRRAQSDGPPEELIADGPSPSEAVAARDLLSAIRRHLSPEERQLMDLRDQGLEWAEIAAKVGGSPEALRKKLTRAVDRAAHELGLDDLETD